MHLKCVIIRLADWDSLFPGFCHELKLNSFDCVKVVDDKKNGNDPDADFN